MTLLTSDYDKSKYLKATDLEREKKFRIKGTTAEEFEQDKKKEKKLTVWFTNDERGLVLNKVNNRTIRGAYGDPTAGWVGKIIVIFPTLADNRGKMTPALRVRIPAPKPATATTARPQQPEATPPQQPVPKGNGAAPAGAAAAPAAADPELEPDPVKSVREEMDDDIPW